MTTLIDLSQQQDLKSIHLLSRPEGIMECNCEHSVLCFLRRLLKYLQPPWLPRVRAESHFLLAAPIPRRKNETGKPKQPPFQALETNKLALWKPSVISPLNAPCKHCSRSSSSGGRVQCTKAQKQSLWVSSCPLVQRHQVLLYKWPHLLPWQGRCHNALSSPGRGWQGRHSFGTWSMIQACNTDRCVRPFSRQIISVCLLFLSLIFWCPLELLE